MKKPLIGESIGKRKQSFSEDEIFRAIEEFEQAGNISIKEFANAFQVSKATFYNWRKRYKTKFIAKDPPKGFIQVDLTQVQQSEEQGQIFAEFRGITFYQRVNPAYLKALL
ncbi:IS66 family insertion sequence element accessory protein TnpA [Flavitalea flava]